MYCRHCGKQIADKAGFCPNCGTVLKPEKPAPEPPPRQSVETAPETPAKKGKSAAGKVALAVLLTFVITAVAAVVLQLTGTLDRLLPAIGETDESASLREERQDGEDTGEENSADTEALSGREESTGPADSPQAVVEQFMLALQQGDAEQALQLCMDDDMLEYGSWEGAVDLGVISPTTPFPGEDPLYQESYRQSQRGTFAQGLRQYIFCLLAPDNEIASQLAANQFARTDQEDLTELAEQMASFRAEDISLLGYGEFRMTSQMQQQVQQSPGSRLYGYSDYREYIMVFQYGGRCFAGGVTVVENERGWQISTLSAPAAGMPQNRLLHLSDLDGMDLEQAAEALQETYEDEYIITVLDQAAGAERRDTI